MAEQIEMTELNEDDLEEAMVGETKNEAFLRLVNKRLPVAVKRLRLIANLSGANYDYTPEQAAQVLTVLYDEVDKVRDAFQNVKAEDSVPTIE